MPYQQQKTQEIRQKISGLFQLVGDNNSDAYRAARQDFSVSIDLLSIDELLETTTTGCSLLTDLVGLCDVNLSLQDGHRLTILCARAQNLMSVLLTLVYQRISCPGINPEQRIKQFIFPTCDGNIMPLHRKEFWRDFPQVSSLYFEAITLASSQRLLTGQLLYDAFDQRETVSQDTALILALVSPHRPLVAAYFSIIRNAYDGKIITYDQAFRLVCKSEEHPLFKSLRSSTDAVFADYLSLLENIVSLHNLRLFLVSRLYTSKSRSVSLTALNVVLLDGSVNKLYRFLDLSKRKLSDTVYHVLLFGQDQNVYSPIFDAFCASSDSLKLFIQVLKGEHRELSIKSRGNYAQALIQPFKQGRVPLHAVLQGGVLDNIRYYFSELRSLIDESRLMVSDYADALLATGWEKINSMHLVFKSSRPDLVLFYSAGILDAFKKGWLTHQNVADLLCNATDKGYSPLIEACTTKNPVIIRAYFDLFEQFKAYFNPEQHANALLAKTDPNLLTSLHFLIFAEDPDSFQRYLKLLDAAFNQSIISLKDYIETLFLAGNSEPSTLSLIFRACSRPMLDHFLIHIENLCQVNELVAGQVKIMYPRLILSRNQKGFDSLRTAAKNCKNLEMLARYFAHLDFAIEHLLLSHEDYAGLLLNSHDEKGAPILFFARAGKYDNFAMYLDRVDALLSRGFISPDQYRGVLSHVSSQKATPLSCVFSQADKRLLERYLHSFSRAYKDRPITDEECQQALFFKNKAGFTLLHDLCKEGLSDHLTIYLDFIDGIRDKLDQQKYLAFLLTKTKKQKHLCLDQAKRNPAMINRILEELELLMLPSDYNELAKTYKPGKRPGKRASAQRGNVAKFPRLPIIQEEPIDPLAGAEAISEDEDDALEPPNTLSGIWKHQTLYFTEKEIAAGDFNTIFTLLGTTRALLVDSLRGLLPEENFRKTFSLDAQDAFYAKQLTRFDFQSLSRDWRSKQESYDKLVDDTKQKHPECQIQFDAKNADQQLIDWLNERGFSSDAGLIRAGSEAVKELDKELEAYFERDGVLADYLRALRREELPLGPCAALLYAKQRQISLYIWRKGSPDSYQLSIAFSCEANGEREIHLLATQKFGDFCCLEKRDAPRAVAVKAATEEQQGGMQPWRPGVFAPSPAQPTVSAVAGGIPGSRKLALEGYIKNNIEELLELQKKLAELEARNARAKLELGLKQQEADYCQASLMAAQQRAAVVGHYAHVTHAYAEQLQIGAAYHMRAAAHEVQWAMHARSYAAYEQQVAMASMQNLPALHAEVSFSTVIDYRRQMRASIQDQLAGDVAGDDYGYLNFPAGTQRLRYPIMPIAYLLSIDPRQILAEEIAGRCVAFIIQFSSTNGSMGCIRAVESLDQGAAAQCPLYLIVPHLNPAFGVNPHEKIHQGVCCIHVNESAQWTIFQEDTPLVGCNVKPLCPAHLIFSENGRQHTHALSFGGIWQRWPEQESAIKSGLHYHPGSPARRKPGSR